MSDTNKLTINDNDGLPLYYQMLGSVILNEQEEACKGLWTLCFHPFVVENVSKNTEVMSGEC